MGVSNPGDEASSPVCSPVSTHLQNSGMAMDERTMLQMLRVRMLILTLTTFAPHNSLRATIESSSLRRGGTSSAGKESNISSVTNPQRVANSSPPRATLDKIMGREKRLLPCGISTGGHFVRGRAQPRQRHGVSRLRLVDRGLRFMLLLRWFRALISREATLC